MGWRIRKYGFLTIVFAIMALFIYVYISSTHISPDDIIVGYTQTSTIEREYIMSAVDSHNTENVNEEVIVPDTTTPTQETTGYEGDEDFQKMMSHGLRVLGVGYDMGAMGPKDSVYDELCKAQNSGDEKRAEEIKKTFVFDCSGFILWMLRKAGIADIPRTDCVHILSMCKWTSKNIEDARPGDFIFYGGTYQTTKSVTHIGMYVGDNKVIHDGDILCIADYLKAAGSGWFVCVGSLKER